MIGFLWFHTLFFPAIVFLGGLISALWFFGKGVDVIDRAIKNAYRFAFYAHGKRRDNFKEER